MIAGKGKKYNLGVLRLDYIETIQTEIPEHVTWTSLMLSWCFLTNEKNYDNKYVARNSRIYIGTKKSEQFGRGQGKISQCLNNRNHSTLATVCKAEFSKLPSIWKVKTWTALKHMVANVYSARTGQNSKTTGSISRILLTTWVHLNLGRTLLFRCSRFVWLAVLLLICGEHFWKLWESHILTSPVKLLSCVVSVHPENIILTLQCSVLLKISGRLKRKRKWLLISYIIFLWWAEGERRDHSRSDSLKETGWGRGTAFVITFQTWRAGMGKDE